jgi:hypothetical protein
VKSTTWLRWNVGNTSWATKSHFCDQTKFFKFVILNLKKKGEKLNQLDPINNWKVPLLSQMDPICDASHGSFRTWSDEYINEMSPKMNYANWFYLNIVTWNWNDSIGIRGLTHFWAVPVIPWGFHSIGSAIEYFIVLRLITVLMCWLLF